jgi:hypothetical protein
MYVKQVSVFLENRKGSLTDLTRTLSDNGIDLIALSIADTEQYGILRCIMTDMEKGVKALKDAGYVVRITDVLAVCVPDRPGGLNAVLEKLTEHDISIEYVYSFVRSTGSHALVIFHLSDLNKGLKVLTEAGVTLLDNDQVRSL